ncbi:hypothetical protein ACO1O0_006033 [Amphichorda felina]
MADPGNPTLDSWRRVGQHNEQSETMGSTVRCMQETGFHRWGYVLYRCTYSDDVAWDYYVQNIYEAVRDSLELFGGDLLLMKYFHLEIIEDRATLDNASKRYVREQFKEWCAVHQSVENGGPATGSLYDGEIPMFHFCLYADQKCLDKVGGHKEWAAKKAEEDEARAREGRPPLRQKYGEPLVPVVLIDKDCDPEGEGPDGYEEIEGCTQEFVGWVYIEVGDIVSLYDLLHRERLMDDCTSYKRPPLVYNSVSSEVMPL